MTRDTDALITAIRGYSPDGVHVMTPLGAGTIRSQIQGREWEGSRSLPAAHFKVELDAPVPYEEHASSRGLDETKMNRSELVKLWRGHEPPFPEEILERGLSRKDIDYLSWKNTGCLDDQDRIFCGVFKWSDLIVDPLFPGAMVEYAEADSEHVSSRMVLPGVIVGGDKRSAWLELFEPLTAMQADRFDTVPDSIKPGFHSSKSVAIGGDTWDAWEAESPDTLPKGAERRDLGHGDYEMMLANPIDLSEVGKFCGEHFPDKPHCVWLSLLFFVLPLKLHGSGRFHPLRAGQEGSFIDAIEYERDLGL